MRKIKKMKNHKKREYFEILNTISKGRHRTNILRSRTKCLAFSKAHTSLGNISMLTFLVSVAASAASFVMAAY